jgi:hypothetical protein
VVLDHAFVPARDEDEMLDAGLACFVNHMLDQRPVDDRKHLLGHGLGRRQKAGSETGHGKYGFANTGHVRIFNISREFRRRKHGSG